MKKNFKCTIIAIFAIVFLLVGCGNNSSSQKTDEKQTQTKTITDTAGKKVEVPLNIKRIGDSWQAHNEVLAMLGAGDKVVATILTEKMRPWLYKVNPQMNKAVTVFGTDTVNTEELVKTKPDIVFTPLNDKSANKISELGIPTVQLNFTDFKGLKECFKLTGDILGDESKKRADQYISYLDNKLNMITDVTSKIPKEQRPKVLHVTSLSPLTVDGSDTIINAWIETAGGVNAASEVKGNNKQISIEQMLKWNPDVVILSSNTLMKINNGKKIKDTLLQDPNWQQVSAVKAGKVYFNPDGAFYWDRYSAEEALQIQWAAKTLNPDKFPNIDIIKETRYFYKTFLNYDLSEEEANKIINDDPPAK
ncbi:ABC transporter substrate-binding protein [Clostridium thailandense]|uniref:ABC transporter substrate-binding protein n=1 Tax=Clostridium thailandense TaxID=2794346 RepID=A0A949U1G3_9CLOT|nr:ABC transporter substrate-binding protein [Clostridium thailandense]MBV7275620.1 ABC transporter substrate-binding protein [Clostridium thailandense]